MRDSFGAGCKSCACRSFVVMRNYICKYTVESAELKNEVHNGINSRIDFRMLLQFGSERFIIPKVKNRIAVCKSSIKRTALL